MRRPILLLLLVVTVNASAAVSGFTELVNGATRIVVSTNIVQLGPKTDVDCGSVADCTPRYFLEIRPPSTPRPLPRVASVTKAEFSDRGDPDPFTFVVELESALDVVQDVVLVAPRLPVKKPAGQPQEDRGEFPLGASVVALTDCRDTLLYMASQQLSTPQPFAIAVKVTDAETKTPVPVKVASITPYTFAESPCETVTPAVAAAVRSNVFAIRLVREHTRVGRFSELLFPALPRAKTLTVGVSGFEPGVSAGNRISIPKYPGTKNDAQYYFSGQRVFSDTSADVYAFDVKLSGVIARSRWDFSPLIDINAGSDAAKLPDYGAAALKARRVFFTSSTFIDRHSISVAPTFRTDKNWDNRDLGADVIWTPHVLPLDWPLDRRRDGNAKAQLSWSVTPEVAIEWGQHLASAAPDVDGTDFKRLRGSVTLNSQYRALSFGVRYDHRLLGDDEVVTAADNTVVQIDDESRGYVRTELTWTFGAAALSVIHVNGKVPPAFKEAHATTLGITFKY